MENRVPCIFTTFCTASTVYFRLNWRQWLRIIILVTTTADQMRLIFFCKLTESTWKILTLRWTNTTKYQNKFHPKEWERSLYSRMVFCSGCFMYVLRLPTRKQVRLSVEWIHKGGKRGSPKKTWYDTTNEDLKEMGLDWKTNLCRKLYKEDSRRPMFQREHGHRRN